MARCRSSSCYACFLSSSRITVREYTTALASAPTYSCKLRSDIVLRHSLPRPWFPPYIVTGWVRALTYWYRGSSVIVRRHSRQKKPRLLARLFVLCWYYLSSRQVTLQVLSAQMSLTAVFGMGTGGPSSQSTPTMSDEALPHPLLCQSPRSALTSSFHFSLTARSW